MDATCTIQDSIHVFSLVHKYVSRILGTYQSDHIINPVILFLLTNRIKSHHNETMSLLQILYQLS